MEFLTLFYMEYKVPIGVVVWSLALYMASKIVNINLENFILLLMKELKDLISRKYTSGSINAVALFMMFIICIIFLSTTVLDNIIYPNGDGVSKISKLEVFVLCTSSLLVFTWTSLFFVSRDPN